MNDKPKYNPNIHHRRSIRLKGYDYWQAGLYFITICCHRRGNPSWLPFGEIENREMKLNDAGTMIENEWLKLPERFTNIQLPEYVVMPNHFHAILEIVGATLLVAQNDDDTEKGQPLVVAPTKTIGNMMDAFKSITTVEYIRGVKTLGWQPFDGKLWQRNYYEHIIRNEQSYQTISEYIINNPAKWADDKFL
jgi:REP element-mobilizing transposase RayT